MNQKLIREIGRTPRLDILTALKRRGAMTVRELAACFQMSYMGVKQHCLDLEKEGYLDTWRRPSRVGRPEMLYRLTARALGFFPGGHNALALEVLDAVQQMYGPAAPTKMLFGIFAHHTEAYRKKIPAAELQERAESLVRLREDEGYLSELQRAGEAAEVSAATGAEAGGQGLRIVEFHSPIEELLRRFPIVARLERELFERVLNCPVRREEEVKPGFYRCTFYLR